MVSPLLYYRGEAARLSRGPQEVEATMKRIVKYGAIVAFLALCLAVAPASAQTVMKDSTCSKSIGHNRLTYDCNFQIRHYEPGTPVTFEVSKECTGECTSVLSFGLKNPGFSPKGVVGRMVGGSRTANGIKVTFVFDTVKDKANAHFTFSVGMFDENGVMKVVPAHFSAHLKK